MVERRRAVPGEDLAASTALQHDPNAPKASGASAGNDLQSVRLKGRDGNSAARP